MEPRHYKTAAEIVLAIGVVLSAIGVVCLITMDSNTVGLILLITGCAMALVSLPTFMILMMLTSFNVIKK